MSLLNQNIFTLLGLDSLPDDRKQQLLDKMTELVQKRLALRLLESLSDEDAKAFESLLETHDMTDPAVAEFFRTKVPNMEEMLKEEIIGIKQELVQTMAPA